MDLSGLFNRLNALEQAIEKGSANGIVKASFLMEREQKKLAPIDTSRLRNSIYASIDRGRMEGWIGPRAFYSGYIIFGTGRYNVKGVRRANGWVYTVKDPRSKYYNGGKPVFTYGQKPNNFPKKAFDNNKDNIEKIIIDEIKSAIRSI